MHLSQKKKNEIKGYLLFVRGGRYHNVIYSDIYVINEFNLLYLGFLLHVVVVYISDVFSKGNEEKIEKKTKKKRNKTLTRLNVDN